MAAAKALLDTDILSAVMKGQPQALAAASAYLVDHGALAFSIMTRYEILRGLKAKGAAMQIRSFERLCESCEIVPLDDAIVVRAAEIYAALRRSGELIGDADILIGATALIHGLAVVTNNEEHFRRIRGLQIVNWLTA